MNRHRRLIAAFVVVVAATLTATGVSMARQPDDRPTFGRLPDAFIDAQKTEPGRRDPDTVRAERSFKETQEAFDIPDYIGVVDETGEVVGYVSAEAMLVDEPPANPEEAIRQQRAREQAEQRGEPVGQEVVDQNLNVVGHLGPKGFVPLGD